MAPRKSQAGALPARVLHGVSWAFRGRCASDRARFEATVRRFQGEETAWRSDEVVLPCPRVRVEYFGVAAPDAMQYTKEVLELMSDNGRAFTAGELLFKLHNAVVGQLRNADHQYFEGITRTRQRAADGVPVYMMEQGS